MIRLNRRDAQSGFTLIELLVVILILGILAALIVPRVVGRASDAKIAKARSDLSELGNLLQQFRLDTGRYPTTEEGLQALRVAPADVQGWKGPYPTKDIPNDPWGNPYIYEYPGSSGTDSIKLMSYGSDGQQGGEGEAADIIEGS
jgi:general secretion pathway protein G